QGLGRVLAYQGRFGSESFPKAQSFRKALGGATAEDELAKAFSLFEKDDNVQSMSIVSAYRSLSALLQQRVTQFAKLCYNRQLANLSPVGQVDNLSYKLQVDNLSYSYSEAHQALEFAEKDAETDAPTPRDFIRAYWLLGESLVQMKNQNVTIKTPSEIHFYDEPFQRVKETATVQAGNELAVAERCLTEALRRCRQVNLVESEADILLAWARLKWVIGESGNWGIGEVEKDLNEAREIAERAGYRLQLADIHLLSAELLLETGGEKLLGLTAQEHLQLAKEYAKDVSTIEHLYQSKDKHFYDGIPEYELLKRGMTEQERIENGYYVAYLIAEALEQKLMPSTSRPLPST
ncbi:MAG: hypothetical protein ONB16_02465, partial [candidate division KSB1 bacterium]|nr:hypothetical protein [candidate division KSB1 bacterium]